MNQAGLTVLYRPIDRQFSVNDPEGVARLRRPELIGPQRASAPDSYAPNIWPGRWTTRNLDAAATGAYRRGSTECDVSSASHESGTTSGNWRFRCASSARFNFSSNAICEGVAPSSSLTISVRSPSI